MSYLRKRVLPRRSVNVPFLKARIELLEDRRLMAVDGLRVWQAEVAGESERFLVNYRQDDLADVRSVQHSGDAPREQVLAALKADPNIRYAEPDYRVYASLTANDPYFRYEWGLHNSGQSGGVPDADIDAPEAWNITSGSTRTTVAIIDSGIDYTHPDLYQNIWINQGEIPPSVRQLLIDVDGDSLITFQDLRDTRNQGAGRITDLNGSGYIDAGDLLYAYRADGLGGWADGISNDSDAYVDDLVGWNFVTGTNNPLDDNGHGTHVAGTVGASGNNGYGVAGVLWNVQLVGLKFLNSTGSGYTSAAVAALNYAVSKGIEVSNNSWGGGGYSTALYNAISQAQAAGHVFVAAAGNGGSDGIGDDNDKTPNYPSSYNLDNIIAVAATDHNDRLTSFSNYGSTSVDLAAPGQNILSTVPGGYSYFSGTSMATPHVAGVVALAQSLYPEWTYSQVIDQTLSSADRLTALTGKVSSGARLNAYGAINVTSGASIIDNGDSGFSTAGNWNPSAGEGFQSDIHFSSAGSGADVATWTFAVSPGQYRVAATWSPHPNRATNSPFSVWDGATLLTSANLNQELAPDDLSDAGTTWEYVGGILNVTGSTLSVRLSDLANEYVIADAVRVERIGDLPTGPELTVLDGEKEILDGSGQVHFGNTFTGVTVDKTFRVRNVGTSDLSVHSIGGSVPAGFSVITDIPEGTMLKPGEEITFTLRYLAMASSSGTVSFSNGDADESPFDFLVSGSVDNVRLLDNGDAGFTTQGNWYPSAGEGFQSDIHFSPAGNGANVATWTIAVPSGRYRIAATWSTHPNRATNAPFSVWDGSTLLASVNVNQESVPNDLSDAGATWEYLGGILDVTSGTVSVQLSNLADEYVIADAIRIERIGDAATTALDGFSEGASLALTGEAINPRGDGRENDRRTEVTGLQQELIRAAALSRWADGNIDALLRDGQWPTALPWPNDEPLLDDTVHFPNLPTSIPSAVRGIFHGKARLPAKLESALPDLLEPLAADLVESLFSRQK